MRLITEDAPFVARKITSAPRWLQVETMTIELIFGLWECFATNWPQVELLLKLELRAKLFEELLLMILGFPAILVQSLETF